MAQKAVWAVGRRKTSVARAKIASGTGKITVNHKDVKDYIKNGEHLVRRALEPLLVLDARDKYDIALNVSGGGVIGQVGAIRHAVARALVAFNESLKPTLKKEGFLTRDSRMVERKKYGLHKARRGTQFSKR
ncbi:30S ribosomal protein S9 [Leptospira levettii]|uniref:Small ribosomal subunit protein uS9 n=2 Tax=Leptospira TaxID=171 RepID=A0A2P2D8S9_9LEPT|nr:MULTISPECIES: 30S ribosomal protein S9 [Leptospira]MCW7462312.1 30S ribosomal protein S9 [Leptospira limi]MCW7495807.1 30S ribosomal protein S9 [Leptospira levettii]TGM32844.1 30S ribosomal protein S9 [Leptospira levettii]TGM93559.1 30S ribosomal protein S9 [Leptospira levettii]GBF41039.1 30S ribosomal protein S9 [Leptospira ellinghausenii]